MALEAMTGHIGDFYPADRVALIATDVEEYDAWLAALRRSRRDLSTYIHHLEKVLREAGPS